MRRVLVYDKGSPDFFSRKREKQIWISLVCFSLEVIHRYKVVDTGVKRYNNGDTWEAVDKSGDKPAFLWITLRQAQGKPSSHSRISIFVN